MAAIKPKKTTVSPDPQPSLAIGPVDPTKNVENLVKALEASLAEFRLSDIKYVDTQLSGAEKLQNYARNAETRLNELSFAAETRLRDALREADKQLAAAETRRIDQLAQTRQEFQNTIRDMLAESVRTTSTLVSTQLVQIQATFDTRVSKLEAGAFTQAGKSSVTDPAVADAMSRIPMSISALANTTAETMAKMVATNAEALAKLTASIATIGATGVSGDSNRMGQRQTIDRIIQFVLLVAAIAGPLIAYLALRQ